jgi:glucuronate isomerase
MRANGFAEKYCSGDAGAYEKFEAWARTVPRTLRNPLYHWTHLELSRYFGIDRLLDEFSSADIWKSANALLSREQMTPQGILRKFSVVALCTTNDPTDSLVAHRKIREFGLTTQMFPTFRPDAALRMDDPAQFNAWVDRLAAVANLEISRLPVFLDALQRRHDFFHENGCRLSDHGLNHCYPQPCADREAQALFDKLRSGSALDSSENGGPGWLSDDFLWPPGCPQGMD